MKEAMSAFSDEDLGANGKHLRDADPSSWFLEYGTLQLWSPEPRHEPKHYDGGCSLLLMGMTMSGRRTLECFLADGQVLEHVCNVGNIYLASACGAEHQVSHLADAGELLHVSGAGEVKVCVLLRCDVFRSSRGAVVPNPKRVFQAAQAVVTLWLTAADLRLPSWETCHETDEQSLLGEAWLTEYQGRLT